MDRRELEEKSGLDARTIRYLIAEKVVPEPNGNGRGASYDTTHLAAISTFLNLKASGLKLDAIRRKIAEGSKTTHTLQITDGLELSFSTDAQRYQDFMLDPQVLSALETLKLIAERKS